MFLEIPKGFTFYSSSHLQNNYAYENENALVIVGSVNFERLMYELTYALKDSRHCYYCNCTLNKNTRTMDHLYPKTFGGISIPLNMAPCCSKCNNEKSNLTEQQYKIYEELIEQEKKRKYKLECVSEMQKIKYSKGFFLPNEWISYDTFRILVEINLEMITNYKGKRYREIEAFYNKYNNLPRPIIISANNFLLDGFLILMFAKEHKIRTIPTIILDNVKELT